MSNRTVPLLTPEEQKKFWPFRPSQWRSEWRTEPGLTKLGVILLALMLFSGCVLFACGQAPLAWILVVAPIVVGLIIILVAAARLTYACLRFACRKTGVAAIWGRIRLSVYGFVAYVFWISVCLMLFVAALPYIEAGPTAGFYAFTNGVSPKRVTVNKKPHDCEFSTAPMGSKHCHYEAHAQRFPGTDSPPYAEPSLWVFYEKIED